MLNAQLLEDIRHNCNIADACSAADFTLCVYLMKMREYYRWHEDIPYHEPLESERVGQWIREKESAWEPLEDAGFTPLRLAEQLLDPFDTEALNQHLQCHNLVYSAGLGQRGKSHFFLAKLESVTQNQHYRIFLSGEELARDLVSPVAMTRGSDIFVRKQALERLIWERAQENDWHGNQTPFTRALAKYDLANQPTQALQQAAEDFAPLFIYHEMGEVMAGDHLGEVWEVMLAQNLNTRLEQQLRGIRDTLADLVSTLPRLLDQEAAATLHFYVGLLSPMRKSMLPGLISAYEHWCNNGSEAQMLAYTRAATQDWIEIAESALDLRQKFTPDQHKSFSNSLEQVIEQHKR